MGINVVDIKLSKKYTDDTADEFGAVKGAPCQIQSIKKEDGTNTVTFSWTNSAGVTKTQDMSVLDGVDGTSVTVEVTETETGHHVVFTDKDGEHPFDITDGGQVSPEDIAEAVAKYFEKNPIDAYTKDEADETFALAEDVPTKVSDLNDAADYAKTEDVKNTANEILDKFVEVLKTKIDTTNLFDIDGEVDVNYTGARQGLNSVSDGVLTCMADSSAHHAVGQIIDTEVGATYIFSGKAVSFGTSDSAYACFYKAGTPEDEIDKAISGLGNWSFEHVAATNKTLFGFATSNGTGAQFTDISVIKK